MNLFLIGYRASGKTTVAQKLSRLLGMPWIDTDQQITDRAGQPIRQIFQQGGEAAFREMEFQTLKTICGKRHNSVVALGGGAVMEPRSRRLVANHGRCVWLRTRPETLATRLERQPAADQRPPLSGLSLRDEIEQLLAERTSIYSACADYTVDTDDLSADETAEAIARWMASVDK